MDLWRCFGCGALNTPKRWSCEDCKTARLKPPTPADTPPRPIVSCQECQLCLTECRCGR